MSGDKQQAPKMRARSFTLSEKDLSNLDAWRAQFAATPVGVLTRSEAIRFLVDRARVLDTSERDVTAWREGKAE